MCFLKGKKCKYSHQSGCIIYKDSCFLCLPHWLSQSQHLLLFYQYCKPEIRLPPSGAQWRVFNWVFFRFLLPDRSKMLLLLGLGAAWSFKTPQWPGFLGQTGITTLISNFFFFSQWYNSFMLASKSGGFWDETLKCLSPYIFKQP